MKQTSSFVCFIVVILSVIIFVSATDIQFTEIDVNNDGLLSRDEIKNWVNTKGIDLFIDALDLNNDKQISMKELTELFVAIDKPTTDEHVDAEVMEKVPEDNEKVDGENEETIEGDNEDHDFDDDTEKDHKTDDEDDDDDDEDSTSSSSSYTEEEEPDNDNDEEFDETKPHRVESFNHDDDHHNGNIDYDTNDCEPLPGYTPYIVPQTKYPEGDIRNLYPSEAIAHCDFDE